MAGDNRHLTPVPDPEPKGADDALEAGRELRDQPPEEVANTLSRCAEIGPSDPRKRPPVPIVESWPGFPFSAALVAPQGYEYRPDGIGQLRHPPQLDAAGKPVRDESKQIVADRSKPPVWTVIRPQPILYTERRKDIHSGQEIMEVAWYRDESWRTAPVPREVLRDARKIVKALAALGVDVTSEDSKGLVLWLADFEAANLVALEPVQVTSSMGWQDEALTTFLHGREQIGGSTIRFQGADQGAESLANAFRAHGTMEGWLAAVEPVQHHPHVLLGLYAGFAAPLLPVLDAGGFAVDFSCRTSTGKTSMLRVIASIWGQSDPGREPSVLGTWDATPVFIERTAETLGNLPVFLDDTARASKREAVPGVVYTITQGQGRGRGSLDGTRRSGRWKTVLLSTGETPLNSFAEKGGARARIATLWGPPWGVGPDTGRLVNGLVAGTSQHYGHAGPVYVRYIVDHRDTWPGLREIHRRAREHFIAKAEGSPEATRLADYMAVLRVAMEVAHSAIAFPWPVPFGLLDQLWPVLAAEVKEAHGADRALAAVYSACNANRESFYNRRHRDNNRANEKGDRLPEDQRQPVNGWWGRWDCDSTGAWQHLSVYPHQLRRILSEAGFDMEPIVRTWAERGWLDSDSDRLEKTLRLREIRSRFYSIKHQAVEDHVL